MTPTVLFIFGRRQNTTYDGHDFKAPTQLDSLRLLRLSVLRSVWVSSNVSILTGRLWKVKLIRHASYIPILPCWCPTFFRTGFTRWNHFIMPGFGP